MTESELQCCTGRCSFPSHCVPRWLDYQYTRMRPLRDVTHACCFEHWKNAGRFKRHHLNYFHQVRNCAPTDRFNIYMAHHVSSRLAWSLLMIMHSLICRSSTLFDPAPVQQALYKPHSQLKPGRGSQAFTKLVGTKKGNLPTSPQL